MPDDSAISSSYQMTVNGRFFREMSIAQTLEDSHDILAGSAAEAVGYDLAHLLASALPISGRRVHVTTSDGEPPEFAEGVMRGMDELAPPATVHRYGPHGIAYRSAGGGSVFPDRVDFLIHLMEDFSRLAPFFEHRKRLGNRMRWKEELVLVLRPGHLDHARGLFRPAGYPGIPIVNGTSDMSRPRGRASAFRTALAQVDPLPRERG